MEYNIYGDSRDYVGLLKHYIVYLKEYASPAQVWAWNKADAFKRASKIKCNCCDNFVTITKVEQA